MNRKILLFLITVFTVNTYSQYPIGFEQHHRKGLMNWKVLQPHSKNGGVDFENSEIHIDKNTAFLMETKKSMELCNNSIYTFEFDFLVDDVTSYPIGDLNIYYNHKNGIEGYVDRVFFKIDSLCKDSIQPQTWYHFKKSVKLLDHTNLKLGFSYGSDEKPSASIALKDFSVKKEKVENYFKGSNLVMNGDFELFNRVPTKLYSSFIWVPFWNHDINLDCVYDRDLKTGEYYIHDAFYISGLNLGSPDIITNELFIKHENEKIIQKNACARIHCYNVRYTNSEMATGEYIVSKLKKPLKKGNTYKLSVQIKLSQLSKYSPKIIGATFSDCAINILDKRYFQKKLHEADVILRKEYLVKKDGWVKISVKYTANGGEKYLTLGCFDSKEAKYNNRLEKDCRNCVSESGIIYLDDIQLIEIDE